MLLPETRGSDLNSELLFTQFGNGLQAYRNQLSVYLSNNVKQPIKVPIAPNNSWSELFNFQNSFNCH